MKVVITQDQRFPDYYIVDEESPLWEFASSLSDAAELFALDPLFVKRFKEVSAAYGDMQDELDAIWKTRHTKVEGPENEESDAH